MPTAKLTSKGQITIPREVREELHLAEGDKLEFLIEQDGTVRLRRLSASVKDLYGFLRRPGQRAASVEQMNETIADHLAEEDRRTRSGS